MALKISQVISEDAWQQWRGQCSDDISDPRQRSPESLLQQAQESLADRMTKQERAQSRREKAKAKAEEQRKLALHNWQEKEKVISKTWLLRQQHTEAVREKSRERNRWKELTRQHYKEVELRRQEELFQAARAQEKKNHDQVAQVARFHRETAELMRTAEAIRQTVLESNKQKLEAKENEQNRKMIQKAEKAHAEACTRRKNALSAKSFGPPNLRAARELARLQSQRLERIRQIQREELQERLDGDAVTCSSSSSVVATGTIARAESSPTIRQIPSSVRPQSAGPYRQQQPYAWQSFKAAHVPVLPEGPRPTGRRPAPPAVATAGGDSSAARGEMAPPPQVVPLPVASLVAQQVKAKESHAEQLTGHFEKYGAHQETVEELHKHAGNFIGQAADSFCTLIDWADVPNSPNAELKERPFTNYADVISSKMVAKTEPYTSLSPRSFEFIDEKVKQEREEADAAAKAEEERLAVLRFERLAAAEADLKAEQDNQKAIEEEKRLAALKAEVEILAAREKEVEAETAMKAAAEALQERRDAEAAAKAEEEARVANAVANRAVEEQRQRVKQAASEAEAAAEELEAASLSLETR